MAVTQAEAVGRMQAKLSELHASGVSSVLIYGAGRHTLKTGETLGRSPVKIVGVIDDALGGRGERLWNWPVLSLEEAKAAGAQAVVISSDSIEDRLYENSAAVLAGAGLQVHRLYGEGLRENGQTFTDAGGQVHGLMPGYRRQVKAGWEQMLACEPGVCPVPTAGQAAMSVRAAIRRVELMERLLDGHGVTVRGGDVLEVGCWDGACCLALAGYGARRVVGIDHQDYFLWNVDPAEADEALRQRARQSMEAIQTVTGEAAIRQGVVNADTRSKVELYNADLHDCPLPDGSFDLVCSWQTLEHLVPPEAGFAAMARLLRPGGFAFHEYASFASRSGGHALCTLDFPWGHVRLSDGDMERYLRTFRPVEYPHAIRFWRRYLNRLLLADLPDLAARAGLELVRVTPWLSRSQYEEEYRSDFLIQGRRWYPRMTMEDLLHDYIALVLRKPG